MINYTLPTHLPTYVYCMYIYIYTHICVYIIYTPTHIHTYIFIYNILHILHNILLESLIMSYNI